MAIHITLGRPVQLSEPDALGRAYFGFDPSKSEQENWLANRADWILGERAQRERHVLFTEHATRTVVMAVKITDIVPSPNKPGKKAIEGRLLGPGDPIFDEYVGRSQPPSTRVRNPVHYLQD